MCRIQPTGVAKRSSIEKYSRITVFLDTFAHITFSKQLTHKTKAQWPK